MRKRNKILVVFDAASPVTAEKDFSEEFKTTDWQTEADVIGAMNTLGYPHEYIGIYNDITLLQQKIDSFKPDILFNLAESFNGLLNHDRDIASLFKLLRIPFTGCGPVGMMLCKDKSISKQILSCWNIRVPLFVKLPRKKPIHRPKDLPFPVIIKPLSEEASYGISQASFVETDEQFRERVLFIHESLNQDVIAEEYIEGREIYASLLGQKQLEVFPLRELLFSQIPDDEPKIATFKTKWDETYRERWGIRNQFAGPLAEGVKENIEAVSKRIYRCLSISGYARIDLRLTPQNEIVFIEANPNPILAKEEDFAQSACKTGLSYPQLIDKIIKSHSLHEED